MTEREPGRFDPRDRDGWGDARPGDHAVGEGRRLPPLDPEPIPPEPEPGSVPEREPARPAVAADPVDAPPVPPLDSGGRPLEAFGDAPERSGRPAWQALGPAFAPRRYGSGRVVVWGCSPGCLVASLLASLLLTLLLNAVF